jgi:hypothetical protein
LIMKFLPQCYLPGIIETADGAVNKNVLTIEKKRST